MRIKNPAQSTTAPQARHDKHVAACGNFSLIAWDALTKLASLNVGALCGAAENHLRDLAPASGCVGVPASATDGKELQNDLALTTCYVQQLLAIGSDLQSQLMQLARDRATNVGLQLAPPASSMESAIPQETKGNSAIARIVV